MYKDTQQNHHQLTIVSTTHRSSHRSTPTRTSGTWSPRTSHWHWAWQHAWVGWWAAASNLHHLHHPPFSGTKYFLFLFLVRRWFCKWHFDCRTAHLLPIQFTHSLWQMHKTNSNTYRFVHQKCNQSSLGHTRYNKNLIRLKVQLMQ